MSGQFKRIALIPAYKPDETMLGVIDGLKSNGFHIVVVNDGSGEDFEDLFYKACKNAKVISFTKNRGKGEALKEGALHIRNNFKAPYIVLTIDADGQHRVDDAIRIVDYAEENPDEFVIGKRNLKLAETPLRSKVGNSITHFGFRQATLTHLNETQTGLRAFSDRIIDKVINVKGTRYEYEMVVLMKLARLGVRIHEIEIETVYENGNSSSHFNPLPDSIRIYWSILKFSWSAMLCFVIDLAVFIIAFNVNSGNYLWSTGDIKYVKILIASNLIARLISTVSDIFINKRELFKNAKSKFKVVILYILLLIAVFTVDTVIVARLSYLRLIPFVGKAISMLLITWISRIIQTKIFEN